MPRFFTWLLPELARIGRDISLAGSVRRTTFRITVHFLFARFHASEGYVVDVRICFRVGGLSCSTLTAEALASPFVGDCWFQE